MCLPSDEYAKLLNKINSSLLSLISEMLEPPLQFL